MFGLPGKALLALIMASTILPILIYAATVALYLGVRTRLERKQGAFDLGRFELPIAIVALVWLVLALVVLATPGEALIPLLIDVGLLVVGGLYLLGKLMFDRKSLVTEPGTVPTQ